MNISKGSVLSFISVLVFPLLGLYLSFKTIRYYNLRTNTLVIALFCAFFTITIPPYQDLYRRYYETYYIYNGLTNFSDAVLTHVDFIYYILVYWVKILGLPFFLVPMISVFVGVYSILDSLNAIFKNQEHQCTQRRIVFSYIILFCFINVLVMAMGIRFGCAAALSIRAVIFKVIENKKIKCFSLFFFAVSLHFSMLLIFIALVVSGIISINRKFVLPLFVTVIFVSNFVFPLLISQISIFGIAQYARSGYVDGKFAAVDTTLNSLIVAAWRYILSVIFLVFYFKEEKKGGGAFENFILIYILISGLTFVSYIAFNRYITEIGIIFYALLFLNCRKETVNNKMLIILILALTNMFFSNIYLQRRPIELGQMWSGLYTSILLRYDYTQNDFESYLKQIDSAGDWIGHELKSDQ